jgi:hypothetical protein
LDIQIREMLGLLVVFAILQADIVSCQQGFDLVQASLDFPYSG